MSDTPKPNLAHVLSGLKDFQRATVDYVFDRLYRSEGSRRFLVADEVGLGKTLVARGVIARAIEHLWETTPRIDIIYICSNVDIARQNINRLNVTGREDFAIASRITMLPVTLKDLKKNRINFVSFTPDTSFNLKSTLGERRERALLYWLLEQAWNLRGKAPLNVLQGNSTAEGFRKLVTSFRDNHEIDQGLGDSFRDAILVHTSKAREEGNDDLRTRFDRLCERFSRSDANIRAEDHKERTALIGELRSLLAVTCLEALEPDLIVLDEFQRFRDLLDGTDRAGDLARGLFEYDKNRILLLSATPYKMYTLEDEAESDDHYKDFLRTYSFLSTSAARTAEFAELLRRYRRELLSLEHGDLGRVRAVKDEIERRLSEVMARTERLAVTDDRNGMLAPVPPTGNHLEPDDVLAYVGLQRVAEAMEEGEPLEYWKSAPYLLNFMDEYKLKEALEAIVDAGDTTAVRKVLERHPGLLLNWDEIQRYRQVDPGNARLRSLAADTLGRDLWRMLWMPPSLPYYALAGPWANAAHGGVTKRLVFSSWKVAPKAIAGLLSYEAERLMLRSHEAKPQNTPEARKKRRGLLRFSRGEARRLTGMPVLGLMYPSAALARLCDPLTVAGAGEALPSFEAALARVEGAVRVRLSVVRDQFLPRLADVELSGPEDETWYWLGPLLLDLYEDADGTRAWLAREDCAARWAGLGEEEEDGDQSAWEDHVTAAASAVDPATRRLTLGPPPRDLERVLAILGLAAPGVVALRALSRVVPSDTPLDLLKDSAGQVAMAFRGLFNIPEVMALVRGGGEPDVAQADDSQPAGGEPYWRRVLDYCGSGGLQAVLDEYVHTLQESLGLLSRPPDETVKATAGAIRDAVSLRTAAIVVDEVELRERSIALNKQRLRARFAVRFGEEESDDGRTNRAEQVRTAFNSPFWPFVLATTSVGQEGLDFHQYCHAVVHWNLPSNPVDLEQREGRVHRFKGHAVRKNVSKHYGPMAFAGGATGDPWARLFAAAVADTPGTSDIVPFWVFTTPGGAFIERHVPSLPLSREEHRLIDLRKALAVYRMVFGQARQEELVSYLANRVSPEQLASLLQELRVDLTPPASPFRAVQG